MASQKNETCGMIQYEKVDLLKFYNWYFIKILDKYEEHYGGDWGAIIGILYTTKVGIEKLWTG